MLCCMYVCALCCAMLICVIKDGRKECLRAYEYELAELFGALVRSFVVQQEKTVSVSKKLKRTVCRACCLCVCVELFI